MAASLAELAAIAAAVRGDSAAISDIAHNWGQSADAGTQQTQAVSTAVDQLSTAWKGTAAESFTGKMRQFAAASRTVNESLAVGSKALSQAAKTIDEVQTKVDALYKSTAATVSGLQNQVNSKSLTVTQAESQAQSVINAAVAKAKAMETQANQALNQVSSKLSSALSSMSKGPSTVPAPTSSGVSPESSGGTGLAGSGSPSGGAGLTGGGGGSAPSAAGVVSGSMVQNAKTIYNYLIKNGYSKFAAAGIVTCIYGESTLSPEAKGTGGWGLIGFTPQFPGEYSNLLPTGNASADLAKQLPAILKYNDGWSQFKPMLNSATSVQQAADIYSQFFERPAVTDSDVHAAGIAIAQQVSGLK